MSQRQPFNRLHAKQGRETQALSEGHTLVAFMLSSKKCASPRLLDMVLD